MPAKKRQRLTITNRKKEVVPKEKATKATKSTKAEANQPGKPHEEYWASQLVSLNQNPPQPTDDVKDALFPFLAEGFIPVLNNGGRTINCAWHALRDSLITLNDWIPDLLPAFGSKAQILTLLKRQIKSNAYKALVERALAFYKDLGDGSYENQKAHLESGIDLDAQQLSWVIAALNELWGTDLILAFITEGFWCTFVNIAGNPHWNYNDENYHQAAIQDSEVRGITNQTVVWVWNNNADTKAHRWGIPGAYTGHWEGFGYNTGQKDLTNSAQRLQDWGFGAGIKADVDRGVWLVTIDCPGYQPQYLDVRVGHFLRDYPPPEGLVIPPNHRYMRTCLMNPDVSHGLVLNENILQVKLDDQAPGLLNKKHVAYIDPPEREKQGPCTAAVVADPLTRAIDSIASYTLAQQNEGQHSRFFRAVEALKKNEEGYDIGDASVDQFGPIDSFTFKNGDFFIESEGRDKERNITNVRSIDNTRGQIHLRRLQHVERPWLLPTYMFEIDPNFANLFTINNELDDDLDKLLKDSKDVPATLKIDKLEQLKDLTQPLPLYEVRRDIKPSLLESTPFYAGEIVRLLERLSVFQDPTHRYQIVDYEGNRGRILWTDLRKINVPFEIILNAGKLDPNFFEPPLPPNLSPSPPPAVHDEPTDETPSKRRRTNDGAVSPASTADQIDNSK